MGTANPHKTLRWGFVGASRIAMSQLAPALLAEQGHALVAVAAHTVRRAEDFAAHFAVPHAHGDYRSLIARDDIDAVYISLRNDQHLAWTLAALEAGKHVLCEKPLALNAREVARMLAAASASDVVLMEAICSGFHPQYQAVDALLAGGTLGRLVNIEARFAARLDDPGDYRWHAAHGGGVLYDIGCYCVAMLARVAGRFPDRVAACMRPRGDVDVSLQALLDFGAFSATMTCSFDAGVDQQMTIAGTGGRVTLLRPYSAIEQAVSLIHNGRILEFAPMNPYRAMLAHFRQAVLSGTAVRHGAGEVLGQAKTLDALFRAAASGRLEPTVLPDSER